MPAGEIITFYSYKGGTGRSMLLANVAWILASNGNSVLAVDWDLEAPGLHKYFQPFLADKELTNTDGVLDFVSEFAVAAVDPLGGEHADATWFHPYADMAQYAVPLDWPFDGGRLDFIGPGRQSPSYPTRLNGFDWKELYERFGGGAFLTRARAELKRQYDFVLLDSRTGLSDTSGICTVQMPDTLVICFTLNNQSVEGAAQVARSVVAQRGGDVTLVTVPMRIDNSEKAKLGLRRQAALDEFDDVESPERLEREWADVEVLYEPYYAYEEILATFVDTPGRRSTVLGSAERVAARLTGGKVTESKRIPTQRRREVLAAYEGAANLRPLSVPVGEGIYMSYRREDSAGFAARMYDALAKEIGDRRILIDTALLPGVDFTQALRRSIESAAVVLVVIGPEWLSILRERDQRDHGGVDFVQLEIELALELDRLVVPVLVEGARMPQGSELPPSLAGLVRRNAIALSESRWETDMRRLIAAIELVLAESRAEPATSAAPTRPWVTSGASQDVLDDVLRSNRMRWVSVVIATISTAVAVATLFLR